MNYFRMKVCFEMEYAICHRYTTIILKQRKMYITVIECQINAYCISSFNIF